MTRLLTIKDVADFLKVSPKEAKDFCFFDATFPRPLRTMRGLNFWEERDIVEWAKDNDMITDDDMITDNEPDTFSE